MELYKTEYSTAIGKGKLDKILLNCKNDSYYKLKDFLYTSQNNQAIVLNALYECNIDVVLKFGYIDSIIKEYNISKELNGLPNFIKYFCKIECNDDIKNIINNKDNISNYKICNYGDNKIGILVMKYYNLGCVNDYEWNDNNFNILKNIIKQVIFAVIYAYKTKGFIHGDLHCGNVLLKIKRNCSIQYESNNLIIEKYEAIIMDFEKSKINETNKINILFRNIDKFITSIIYSSNIKLNIDYDRNELKSIFALNIDYVKLEEIIDNMTLLYD